MGCGARPASSSRYGRIWSDPSAQLRPTASSSGACITEYQNASVVCPTSVRPLWSTTVPESITGMPEPGPDEVELSTFPFQQPTAIAGPVMARLNVSSTAPDTELFVQLPWRRELL